MEQRDSTTFSTSAKSAPDGSAAVSRRVAGCALSQTMAASPAAAAAQVHHGPLPVLCLVLKKWRMTAPIARTTARISQFQRLAKARGSGLAIMGKMTGTGRELDGKSGV